MEPSISTPAAPPSPKRGWLGRCLTGLGLALVWLGSRPAFVMGYGRSFNIDVRLIVHCRLPLTILYGLFRVAIWSKYKLHLRLMLLWFGMFLALSLPGGSALKPTNTGDWQADVDRPARGQTHGDQIPSTNCVIVTISHGD